jgi:hypothetical protein
LVVWSFGISYGLILLASTLFKLSFATPLSGNAFVVLVGCLSAVTWGAFGLRVWRGARVASPIADRRDFRRIVWTLTIVVVFLLTAMPALLWQDMHDDGFEALEIGRSLSTHLLPRFPSPRAVLGIGAGMVSMAFPVHWFVALFGPLEVSARLPMLLYLSVLFCLLVELIEWDSARRMGFPEEAALCIGLGAYATTMCFNASYNAYFADIAAPAAFETLTVLCISATIYFLWRDRLAWFLFFAILSYLCRPTGLLVLVFAGLAALIAMPDRRVRRLKRIVLAIGLCVLVTVVYDSYYVASFAESDSGGIPFMGVLARFRYLRIGDFSRFLWVIVPSGFLPFFSLFLIRWQDSFSKFISVVALSYFSFFYIPAFVALHHFVPVMILPMVVFWRMVLNQSSEPVLRLQNRHVPALVMLATGALALGISLPRHFEIDRTMRYIGQKIDLRIGDYETDFREQVRHADLLLDIVPPDWEVEDPDQELISGYCSVIYYATRPKVGTASLNYLVKAPPGEPEGSFHEVANDGDAALYVRDLEEWKRDQTRAPRTDFRSRAYEQPRTTLFRHWGAPQGFYTVDLKRLVLAIQNWTGLQILIEPE